MLFGSVLDIPMLDRAAVNSVVLGSTIRDTSLLDISLLGSTVRDSPMLNRRMLDRSLYDKTVLARPLLYIFLLENAVREIVALEGPVLVGCRPEVECRCPSSRRRLCCWHPHWLGGPPVWHTVGHIHPVVRECVPGVRLIHASVGAYAGQLADPFAWMVRNAHIDVVRHGYARVVILIGTTRVDAAHSIVLLKRGINTAHGLRRYD